jgi:hypothetical protein
MVHVRDFLQGLLYLASSDTPGSFPYRIQDPLHSLQKSPPPPRALLFGKESSSHVSLRKEANRNNPVSWVVKIKLNVRNKEQISKNITSWS